MGIFRFKNFSIQDDHTPMKVGMDAVFLGAWADGGDGRGSLLDAGTGCGIIALMMAWRFPHLKIDGLDIHPGAVGDALENLKRFPVKADIRFFEADYRNFNPLKKYDFIVTNPPYLLPSKKSREPGRNLARYSDALPPDILLMQSAALLTDEGKLSLIIPWHRMQEYLEKASAFYLYLSRRMVIRHYAHSEPRRVLLELTKNYEGTIKEEEMIIKTQDEQYTEAYRQLTKDFYLNF